MGRARGGLGAVSTAGFTAVVGTRRGAGRGLTKRPPVPVRPYTLQKTPSAVARTVAGQCWPSVQKQRKLADGVFGFTCAGHGGIVAVIGKADLDPAHVAAARQAGLTELVVSVNGKTYSTAEGYKRSDLEGFADMHPSAEVWVGEEDCAWATVLYDSPELLAGAKKAGYLGEVDAEDVSETVANSSEDFLAALYADYTPRPGGQLDKARKRAKLLEAGAQLRSSAVNEGDAVRVTFTGADGERSEYLMSRETYRSIPLLDAATVDDYRAFGEVVQASSA